MLVDRTLLFTAAFVPNFILLTIGKPNSKLGNKRSFEERT